MKLFFLGVFLICSTTVTAETLFPPAFNATYEINKSGLVVAEIKYQLSHQQQTRFTSVTLLTGLASLFSNNKITEESLFETTTPATIQLQQYQFQQTGDETQSINSKINWQQKNITTTINKEAPIISSFTQTLWDKHSAFLALMTHANDQKKSLVFNTLDKGIIKPYNFKFIRTKEIELDDDEWKQAAVWQIENYKKRVIFYLDPNNLYIPLKIEEYRNSRLRATLWLTELNWYE